MNYDKLRSAYILHIRLFPNAVMPNECHEAHELIIFYFVYCMYLFFFYYCHDYFDVVQCFVYGKLKTINSFCLIKCLECISNQNKQF